MTDSGPDGAEPPAFRSTRKARPHIHRPFEYGRPPPPVQPPFREFHDLGDGVVATRIHDGPTAAAELVCVRVQLSTGWMITHYPLNGETAVICPPIGRSGVGSDADLRIRVPDPVTVERLHAALVDYVRDHDNPVPPGDRVRVKLSTGWTITHTGGEPTADISHPGYRRVTGAVPAPSPATVESLAAALVKFIRAGAEPRPISRRHPRPGEGNHTWGIPLRDEDLIPPEVHDLGDGVVATHDDGVVEPAQRPGNNPFGGSTGMARRHPPR